MRTIFARCLRLSAVPALVAATIGACGQESDPSPTDGTIADDSQRTVRSPQIAEDQLLQRVQWLLRRVQQLRPRQLLRP